MKVVVFCFILEVNAIVNMKVGVGVVLKVYESDKHNRFCDDIFE